MAIVLPATNRIDTFAAAHGLIVQDLIRYNLSYFLEHRTMWLPVGTDLLTAPAVGLGGVALRVGGRRLLVNGSALRVTT